MPRRSSSDRRHSGRLSCSISNAQNCVQVCPKEIPLTQAIGELGRQATVKLFKDLFWK
jgi:succinate dehydrogenase/fumarate reductase-like Fe-S protein